MHFTLEIALYQLFFNLIIISRDLKHHNFKVSFLFSSPFKTAQVFSKCKTAVMYINTKKSCTRTLEFTTNLCWRIMKCPLLIVTAFCLSIKFSVHFNLRKRNIRRQPCNFLILKYSLAKMTVHYLSLPC